MRRGVGRNLRGSMVVEWKKTENGGERCVEYANDGSCGCSYVLTVQFSVIAAFW